MRRIMLFAAFLLATHVPATASAEQPVYPPEGCYLVKGVAVNDGRAGNHNVTYRVAEVLCGPADLKDRYFLARFAEISRNEEACILGNLSRTRRGEETYHWITLGIGPDGPLTKDIRFDSVREGDARPDGTFRSSKACCGRHVSLTFATGGSIFHPQLGDLVPVPHKFPTTGPLWPDVQKRVDDLRAAGKDPL